MAKATFTIASVTKSVAAAMANKLAIATATETNAKALAELKASKMNAFNTGIATSFAGTAFGDEDTTKILIGAHIATFGEPEPKDGKPGKVSDATLSEYRLLANAGKKGIFATANAVVDEWQAMERKNGEVAGERQRNLLNLLRDHEKEGCEISVASIAKGRKDRERSPRAAAKSAIKSFAKKLDRKFGLKIDTKAMLALADTLSDVVEDDSVPAVVAPVVTQPAPVAQPAPTIAPVVPASQPANVGMDIQAIMSQPWFQALDQNAQGAVVMGMVKKS